MAHKYVTPELIKNLEQEIAACQISIDRIRVISRGGKEAVAEMAIQIREFAETAKDKKNQALDMGMQDTSGRFLDPVLQERAAIFCRGQEKAFGIVLEMLENPTQALEYYAIQKAQAEKDLAKYKTFEQRKD